MKLDKETAKKIATEFGSGRGRAWHWVAADIRCALVAAEVMDRIRFATQQDADRPISARQITELYNMVLDALSNMPTFGSVYSTNTLPSTTQPLMCARCNLKIFDYQGRTPTGDGTFHAACMFKKNVDRWCTLADELLWARAANTLTVEGERFAVATLDSLWATLSDEDRVEATKRVGPMVQLRSAS